MRKLLGYLLREEYEYLTQSAKSITGYEYEEKDNRLFFYEDSKIHKNVDEAGVMHWFEEFYKDDKTLTKKTR